MGYKDHFCDRTLIILACIMHINGNKWSVKTNDYICRYKILFCIYETQHYTVKELTVVTWRIVNIG